ncbi:MAG: type II secretion system inner membrane protein GspF [Candidatus Hydrogenedentes bacterium]|nr:type II secretion system inner membrane protein GspF [Candidatus Hydrogenedentota bacterium]
MAVYEYQAIARTGKTVKGVIDADSPAAARRKLREQELHPTKVAESFGAGTAERDDRVAIGRISQREVSLMTRQLAVLLQAGMPLVDGLSALIDQTSNARLRKNIYDVRGRVNEGSSLAEALGHHRRVFSELYVNMVRAGESSGGLEQVLFRLADIMERNVRLQHKVLSLLAYPCVMVMVSVGIITFLMVRVIPKIVLVFEHQKHDLPGLTKAMMATSYFIGHYWWAMALAMIGLFGLWRVWVARPDGRRTWDRIKLGTPLVGQLYQKMVCVRFTRTLGTMLESGLTMMTALDVVKTVLQNRVMQEALDEVKTGVRRGRDLSAPLKETGLFPPLVVHMVELGQRSGAIESMLIKVADTYDEDVELTVNGIVSVLEPLMIVVMGLFVGTLVLSILLPIFSMSTHM